MNVRELHQHFETLVERGQGETACFTRDDMSQWATLTPITNVELNVAGSGDSGDAPFVVLT